MAATETGNELAYAGAAFTLAASAYQAISSVSSNKLKTREKLRIEIARFLIQYATINGTTKMSK